MTTQNPSTRPVTGLESPDPGLESPAPAPALPIGFTVRLNRLVRVRDGGRTLVGGAPTRVLYLTPKARRMLRTETPGPPETTGRRCSTRRRSAPRRSIVLKVTDAASRTLADRLLEAGMADPVTESLPTIDESLLTYVVPAHDRPEALDRLLTSIGRGRSVIVVDDCSMHPGSVAEVVRAHGATLLVLPVNVGPGGARNAGLREVQTPYVAFVDSDVVLEPGTMGTLLKHFADRKVAMVSPRIAALSVAGTASAGWIGRYEQARSSLDLGVHPAIVRQRAPVSWVPSACLVARVDVLGEGFSAELRVGEDVDLVWRLAERGWRVRYEPAATVRHEHRVKLGDWMLRKAEYGTGSYELGRRHPGDIAPAILSPWSAGLVVAVLAQRRWSLPVAAVLMLVTTLQIRRKVTSSDHPLRLAAELTATGSLAALSQAVALLLRHWWPLTLVGCLLSRRLRRASLIAAVVDLVVEAVRTDAQLDPLRFALARRLDDLAYGSGVWLSAMRGRSLQALLPDLRREH